MRRPLEFDDAKDREFMATLIEVSSLPRYAEIMSPSSLADCIRKVYFGRTGQEKKFSPNIAASAIFLNGHFIHLKWQYAVWKLHRKGVINIPTVRHEELGFDWLAMEWRVKSKHEDFGGTLDTMLEIHEYDDPFLVDYKGMRADAYMTWQRAGTPENYNVQITGYSMLIPMPWRVKTGILLVENKNGNDPQGSPLALHEYQIDLSRWKSNVKDRLAIVRNFEEAGTVPPPSCESTSSFQFQGCPFKWYCRGEVREIELARKSAKDQQPSRPRVAAVSRRRTDRSV